MFISGIGGGRGVEGSGQDKDVGGGVNGGAGIGTMWGGEALTFDWLVD